MSSRNHAFTYRPVLGGILVVNPANDRPGTLGAIATRDGTDRLALSCYHVLGRADGTAFPDGEPILQSLSAKGGSPIGRVFLADCVPAMDLAAARIDLGIDSAGWVLGLGPLAAPSAPAPAMRVLKAGAFTGVTEGEVVRVQGDRVEIKRPASAPSGYELCDFGDSGAMWVDRATGSPVALHTGQAPDGTAVALSLPAVLRSLSLRLVLDG